MQKVIIGSLLIAAAFSVCAETVTGFVFSENNGKYWRIGKKGGNGENIAVAILPAVEADKASPFDGKTVKVTGELDSSSGFKKFKPGFTIEEVKE